jgi:hypothetical protein
LRNFGTTASHGTLNVVAVRSIVASNVTWFATVLSESSSPSILSLRYASTSSTPTSRTVFNPNAGRRCRRMMLSSSLRLRFRGARFSIQ